MTATLTVADAAPDQQPVITASADSRFRLYQDGSKSAFATWYPDTSPAPGRAPSKKTLGAHTIKLVADDGTVLTRTYQVRVATPPPPPPPPVVTDLQAAINAAANGATIDVTGQGPYHQRIYLSRPITLIGAGIDVTGLGVPTQQGGITITGSDIRVVRADVQGSGGAGIRVESPAARVSVEDSRFHDNVQEGYSVSLATDLTFLRCTFDYNNAARTINPGWEAGGGKAHGTRISFIDCEAAHNGGPGIWFDQWYDPSFTGTKVYNPGAIVRGCSVHDNAEAGIMYEVSDGALIEGNAIWANGNPSAGWFWAAGILISSSRNVEIRNNTLSGNLDGISVLSQNRADRPGYTSGVNIHDNIIVEQTSNPADTSDKAMLAFAQDWAGHMFDAGSGNVGAANQYWSVYGEPRYSRFVWNAQQLDTLAKLNATPAGGSSVYLTTAQKDAALAAAGITA